MYVGEERITPGGYDIAPPRQHFGERSGAESNQEYASEEGCQYLPSSKSSAIRCPEGEEHELHSGHWHHARGRPGGRQNLRRVEKPLPNVMRGAINRGRCFQGSEWLPRRRKPKKVRVKQKLQSVEEWQGPERSWKRSQRPMNNKWNVPEQPVRSERRIVEAANDNQNDVVERFRCRMSDHFARKNWKNIAPALENPNRPCMDSASNEGLEPTLHKWISRVEGAEKDEDTEEWRDLFEVRMPGKRLIRILYQTQFEALDKIYEQLTQKPAEIIPRDTNIPITVIEKLRALAENDLRINLGGYFIPGWDCQMPSFQERYYEYFHEILRYWEFGNFYWIHEFLEAVCNRESCLEVYGYEGMDGAWFGLRSDLQAQMKHKPRKKEWANVDIEEVKGRITNFMSRQVRPVRFKEFRRLYARSQGKSHALAPTKWGFLDTADMIKKFASDGADIDLWERKSTRYVVSKPKHHDYWRRTNDPPDWEHLL